MSRHKHPHTSHLKQPQLQRRSPCFSLVLPVGAPDKAGDTNVSFSLRWRQAQPRSKPPCLHLLQMVQERPFCLLLSWRTSRCPASCKLSIVPTGAPYLTSGLTRDLTFNHTTPTASTIPPYTLSKKLQRLHTSKRRVVSSMLFSSRGTLLTPKLGKTDYGIMVFADKRFNRVDKRAKLPPWILYVPRLVVTNDKAISTLFWT